MGNDEKCSLAQEQYVAYGVGLKFPPIRQQEQVKTYIIITYALYCARNTKVGDPAQAVPLISTAEYIVPPLNFYWFLVLSYVNLSKSFSVGLVALKVVRISRAIVILSSYG